MLVQTRVGQRNFRSQPVDSNPEIRAGQMAEVIVSQLQGPYYENTYFENSFAASNQAARSISVALATTYTGLCLSNPIGNNKNIVLNHVGLALSVAPAAIATIGLITGFSAVANVTHTSALTPRSCKIGSPVKPTALADDQSTLTGTPVWDTQLWSGFTAAALPASTPSLIDIKGQIVLIPGAYVAIGALTAVTGLWSMSWTEVPV